MGFCVILSISIVIMRPDTIHVGPLSSITQRLRTVYDVYT